jgi:hypothetical protein
VAKRNESEPAPGELIRKTKLPSAVNVEDTDYRHPF